MAPNTHPVGTTVRWTNSDGYEQEGPILDVETAIVNGSWSVWYVVEDGAEEGGIVLNEDEVRPWFDEPENWNPCWDAPDRDPWVDTKDHYER